MVILKLTEEQFVLLKSSVEIHLDECLRSCGLYSSPEYYDKDELDGFLQERDDLFELLEYFNSCGTSPNGETQQMVQKDNAPSDSSFAAHSREAEYIANLGDNYWGIGGDNS